MSVGMLRAAEKFGLNYDQATICRLDHPTYAVLPLGDSYVVTGNGKRLRKFSNPYDACSYLIEVLNEVIYRSSAKTRDRSR